MWYDMIWYMICDLWYVICDMWYMIGDLLCDVWYVIYGMICDIWCDIIMISWLWFIFEKSVSGFLWQTGGFPKSKCCFFFDQTHQRHPTQKSTLPCTYFVYPNWSMSLMAQRRQKKKKQGQTGQTDQLGWHRHSWGQILRGTINFLSVLEKKKDTVATSKYTDLQITTGICLYLRVVWPALHIFIFLVTVQKDATQRVIVQFSPQHRTGERPVCREALWFCTILHPKLSNYNFCWGTAVETGNVTSCAYRQIFESGAALKGSVQASEKRLFASRKQLFVSRKGRVERLFCSFSPKHVINWSFLRKFPTRE